MIFLWKASVALVALINSGVIAAPVQLDKPAEPWTNVRLTKEDEHITLENGYIRLSASLAKPSIDVLMGSFDGIGDYKSVLSETSSDKERRGFVTELHVSSSQVLRPGTTTKGYLQVAELMSVKEHVKVSISGISDNEEDPTYKETWTLGLKASERFVTLTVAGELLKATTVNALRHSLYTDPTAGFGLFDKGIVQMLDQDPGEQFFASTSPMYTWYAIGEGKAAEVVVDEAKDVQAYAMEVTDCCDPAYKTGSVPIEQAFMKPAAKNYPYHTAFHTYVAGRHRSLDRWGNPDMEPVMLEKGKKYRVQYLIAAVDGNFPVIKTLPRDASTPNMPSLDLRAYLTAIWSAPVGVMRTYETPGLATPTIWRPEPSYEGNYNFFDPDCYLTVTALVFSGNQYLHKQVRSVLDKTVEFVRHDGLMPHHLTIEHGSGAVRPVYTAISGAVQPGPNIFWTLAAIEYTQASGDTDWLKQHLQHIDTLVEFLVKRIDPVKGLIDATGPLMIDVFKREEFTTDTNGGAVFLFNELKHVYEAFGMPDKVKNLNELIHKIRKNMNEHLWDGDHFVTSLSRTGQIVDMVDYDSNLIAVAAGVPDMERSSAILKRVDSGPCTHARATWVSERPYDVQHVYSGPASLGDSQVTMARIGWFDAHSRKRLNQQEMFHCTLLNPIRDDLLEYLWLNERYNCKGQRNRGYGFMFYPSMVAMMSREIRYGIHIGMTEVRIEPFGPSAYNYDVGDVRVAFSADYVNLRLPGDGERDFAISRLLPEADYYVALEGSASSCSGTRTVKSDNGGTIKFRASLSCDITANAVGNTRTTVATASDSQYSWLTCFNAPRDGEPIHVAGAKLPDQDKMIPRKTQETNGKAARPGGKDGAEPQADSLNPGVIDAKRLGSNTDGDEPDGNGAEWANLPLKEKSRVGTKDDALGSAPQKRPDAGPQLDLRLDVADEEAEAEAEEEWRGKFADADPIEDEAVMGTHRPEESQFASIRGERGYVVIGAILILVLAYRRSLMRFLGSLRSSPLVRRSSAKANIV